MRESEKKYCVVDAGNTHVKVVDFKEDEIVGVSRVAFDDTEKLKSILFSKKDDISILSSVLSEENRIWIEDQLAPNVVLNHKTPLPISLDAYETKSTLGADRIANAVAANYYSISTHSLVVDIGTCIKFDFIKDSQYLGGSISPGYTMRLKAMHEFTGALPLLDLEEETPFIGISTKSAMMSGVIHGISAEINGFLERYTQGYQPLTIFLTGGDHKRFDKALKNGIFADDNLTVKGLYLILKHNV